MAFVHQSFPLEDAEWVDFEQFLDFSSGYDDQSTATISPQATALPYQTDFTSPLNTMQQCFDMSYNIEHEFMGMDGGMMHDPAAPLFDDAAFAGYNPYDSSNAFRSMVEAQAAADPRTASTKEKRREAAIALHLQRLCDDTALELDMSSDSNASLSSPNLSDYVRESTSPGPSHENTPTEASPSAGMELVLDLNMNATSNLPKKQKPRSQAQRENYIKARKYGACEKHKKQHKRCNCLEKAAARAEVGGLPITATPQQRPRPTMPQVPVLPELRSSMLPGHDPASQSPALQSAKVTKKLTSFPSGHDTSTRLPAVPQEIVRIKSQKSTPPGRYAVHQDVSDFNHTSCQDLAHQYRKQIAKSTVQTHDKAVRPGTNIAKKTSPGHDILLSGKVSKAAGIDQGRDVCPSIQNTRATHIPNSSNSHWRVSTSAAPERANRTTLPDPSTVVHPRTTGFTATGTIVPGSVAGNLGIRPAFSRGVTVLGQARDSQKLSTGVRLVSKDQLARSSWLGLVVSGSSSPESFGNGPVHSLARIRAMVSRTVEVVCAQSSLSIPHHVEATLLKGVSLAGRCFMSMRRAFNLLGPRT